MCQFPNTVFLTTAVTCLGITVHLLTGEGGRCFLWWQWKLAQYKWLDVPFTVLLGDLSNCILFPTDIVYAPLAQLNRGGVGDLDSIGLPMFQRAVVGGVHVWVIWIGVLVWGRKGLTLRFIMLWPQTCTYQPITYGEKSKIVLLSVAVLWQWNFWQLAGGYFSCKELISISSTPRCPQLLFKHTNIYQEFQSWKHLVWPKMCLWLFCRNNILARDLISFTLVALLNDVRIRI